MSILWPARKNPFPGVGARLGRVVHYASFIPATYVLWVAFGYEGGRLEPGTRFGLVAVAALIVLAARGFRWIAAAE